MTWMEGVENFLNYKLRGAFKTYKKEWRVEMWSKRDLVNDTLDISSGSCNPTHRD